MRLTVVILCIILAASLSWNVYQSRHEKSQESAVSSAAGSETAEVYQCPMHPTIVQDHPADCPLCGMKLVKMKGGGGTAATSAKQTTRILFYRSPIDPDQTTHEPRAGYIPVYESESGGGDVEERTAVTIDPSRQQMIGLRTEKVTRGDVGGGWYTVGRVEADPTRVNKITVKVAGFVEKTFADFVGKPVRRGDPLFSMYSPELLVAQQEFLLTLKSKNASTASAARRKLELWNVSSSQIDELEQSGEARKSLTFTSPVSGNVTAKNIVDGSSVAPGDTPYEVTDLSTVWVIADVYQNEIGKVMHGMKASMSFESLPDRVIIGTVEFIDPLLSSDSRTVTVRLVVDNPEGELKPGMFGEVYFRGRSRETLVIPADAVVPSGRGSYVFVAMGEGRFEPRAVTVGEQSDGVVEITAGLEAGESVVVRANFLVDSESLLRAALTATQNQ